MQDALLFVTGSSCHGMVFIVPSQDVTQLQGQLEGVCHAEQHTCALDLAAHSHPAS